MDVQWLQLPADLPDRRAAQLALLLSARGGRKVSEGDALLLVVRLWQSALTKVNEHAPSLEAELARCSRIAFGEEELVAVACRWPSSRAGLLLEAMANAAVGVLEHVPGGWRILGLPERYAALATRKAESRGRAQASRLAKQHGWRQAEGGGWFDPRTGETVDDWRALLARLQGGKDGT